MTYRRSEVEPADVYGLRMEAPADTAMHEFQAMEDPASGSSRGRGVSQIVDDLAARLEHTRSTPIQKPTMPKSFPERPQEGSN